MSNHRDPVLDDTMRGLYTALGRIGGLNVDVLTPTQRLNVTDAMDKIRQVIGELRDAHWQWFATSPAGRMISVTVRNRLGGA